jgi:molecular chaperone GrpE
MTEPRRRIPIEYRDPAGTSAFRASAEDSPEGGGQTPRAGDTAAGDTGERPSSGTGEREAARTASVADGQTPTGPQVEKTTPAEEQLSALTAERDEYLDRLLRLKAEFENFRKRSRRELAEAEERARGRLLVEFLPVMDNLGRALDAAEHHEEGKVLEGVRLTHGQFVGLLAKEGVSEIAPLGEPFDPHHHDAMLTQPSEAPEGTVVAVLERGYALGDRVLRPARVAVSSGPLAGGREAGE